MISNQETHRIRTSADPKTFVERRTNDMRMLTNMETSFSSLRVKSNFSEPQIKSPVNCRDSRWPADMTLATAPDCATTTSCAEDNIEAGILEDANAMRLEIDRAGRCSSDQDVRSGSEQAADSRHECETIQ